MNGCHASHVTLFNPIFEPMTSNFYNDRDLFHILNLFSQL